MAPTGRARRWYVVHTKPKQEARAEANLRAWAVETLYPRVRSDRSRAHGHGDHPAPLFPRYLFARFEAEVLLAKVRMTRGVHDVLAFGGCATPVDDDIIALMRTRIEADGFVRVGVPQLGDLVEIADGPLRSFIGIFEREMDSHDRVMVLLTSVGSHARIHIAKADIRKAPVAAIA